MVSLIMCRTFLGSNGNLHVNLVKNIMNNCKIWGEELIYCKRTKFAEEVMVRI